MQLCLSYRYMYMYVYVCMYVYMYVCMVLEIINENYVLIFMHAVSFVCLLCYGGSERPTVTGVLHRR